MSFGGVAMVLLIATSRFLPAGNKWLSNLTTESLPGQGQCPMDHHFLAQGCRNDVREASEWAENEPVHQLAQRLKEKTFAHERYTPTNDDPPRTQKSNHVANAMR